MNGRNYIIILLLIITFSLLTTTYAPQLVSGQYGGSAEAETEAPAPQTQEAVAEAEAEDEAVVQLDGLDNSRNMQVVIPGQTFTSDGLLKTWKFTAGRTGIVHFQVYRPVRAKSNTYALVGENIYQVTTLGENMYEVPPMSQIAFKKGDIIGLRFPDLGIVKFNPAESEVKIAVGSSLGLGVGMNFPTAAKRSYALLTEFRKLESINVKALGGNEHIPARSAQAILAHYTDNKLGTPVDGVYWLKSKNMKKAEQVHCVFSYRKGHGYMLVGSVSPGDTWAPFETGSYPFNPHMTYGVYDKYGRNGTYYMPWAKFDASAVIDSDPASCRSGGFSYNNDGKFCGQKKDNRKRVQLKGGFTELMLATGNGKYWVVADRTHLEYPHKDNKQKIKPVASSDNFDGKCEQNKYMYIETHATKPETPWINMGNGHACDSNIMLWGENNDKNNISFMQKNGGVQIFVGGSFAGHNRNKKFPHNPSYHTAPGRGGYQTSFREAQNVCKSMGKKMCSFEQLKKANKAGYSQCACGWTDTKVDKYRYRVGYPTNLDRWGSLQGTRGKGWCGRPGVNTCGYARKDQGIWGRRGADVYCCDAHEYSTDFDKLDAPFNMARVWISTLEQKFESVYGSELPDGAQFVVLDKGYGVYVKKTKNGYRLLSHSKGKMSQKGLKVKAQIPEGVIRVDPKTLAVFTKPINEVNIKKNTEWPSITGGDQIVRLGTVMQLENTGVSQYLSGSSTLSYWQSHSSKNKQVFTFPRSSSGGWLLKSIRGQGKLDNSGNGDEKANFGKPVKSGTIVRLEHVNSGRNLTSNPIFRAPGTTYPEVSLGGKGVDGDSNDYWRVETSGSKYWYVNAPVRFVHVNTGKCLQVSGRTYKTKTSGGTKVNVLHTDVSRGNNDMWIAKNTTIPPVSMSKCQNYLHKIAEARQAIKSGSPEASTLKATIRKYKRKYNKECNKMSQNAYNRVVYPQLDNVKRTRAALRREEKIAKSYNRIKNKESATKNGKDNTKNTRDKELQKLLAKKCLPVKLCVDQAKAGNQPIAKECSALSTYMTKSEITDDLINKIKEIKRAGDNISNYDIRTHKNYYKLAKATGVKSCY